MVNKESAMGNRQCGIRSAAALGTWALAMWTFTIGSVMAAGQPSDKIVMGSVGSPGQYAGKGVDEICRELKQYHIVTVGAVGCDFTGLTPEKRAAAENLGAALVKYMNEGGGVLLMLGPTRYVNDSHNDWWQLVVKPLGVENVSKEGVFDATRVFQKGTPNKGNEKYFHTQNIQEHPVTRDVKRLFLPLHNFGNFSGVMALRYSPEWKVVIAGEKESKSYMERAEGGDYAIDLTQEGFYKSEPPVLAVREFGKGRIVSYPLAGIHAGVNYDAPGWPNVVEEAGDKGAGLPSDGNKLMENIKKWLAEPALNNPEFGTYRPPEIKPVVWPEKVSWPSIMNLYKPARFKPNQVSGIMGARTAYAGGKGTVREYVEAAKQAGLDFIVFNDPLENLTAEKLEQLKKDCEKQSDDAFVAVPGVEFSDGLNNRWALWGSTVVYPDSTLKDQGREWPQWDGKRVNCWGAYISACVFSPNALIDYRSFRERGCHPENMWWIWDYLPFVYDNGKLVEDNFNEYLKGLRDLRWASIESYTRIDSPAAVASAAKTCRMVFPGLAGILHWSKSPGGRDTNPSVQAVCVTEGPEVDYFESFSQMESNWKYTRGAQRVPCAFSVRSEDGIAEVRVHDMDRGLIRRFDGKGAKTFFRVFEVVHDQQHRLALEVIDTKGKRAIGQHKLIFCYKQGLYRCGDNLNILGPTSILWHPDRNEMLPIVKDGEAVVRMVVGWDSSCPGVPLPAFRICGSEDGISTVEYGENYPDRYKLNAIIGRVMDRVILNSHNLQIASMNMTHLSPAGETKERPAAVFSTIAHDIKPLDFYKRRHTIYAPMTRTDWFLRWNHRRYKEAAKDYRGGFVWHEGEIEFTKDVTLKGDVPIVLVPGWYRADGELILVTDAAQGTRAELVRGKKETRFSGRVRPGGYVVRLPQLGGYGALLTPPESDFTYSVNINNGQAGLSFGLGADGQKVKAGTVMKYRFLGGTFATDETGNALLNHTVKAMNMAGGRDGYPIEMKAGKCTDATFFFTVESKNNEALFKLGPQSLIIDLPIRIKGLDYNGCAAVYSTKRPWFLFVPVATDGIAYFQEPIDEADEIWAGNILACNNKDVKISVVIDGIPDGEIPYVEIHNPTDKAINTKIFSPEHTPLIGGLKATMDIPAGDSVYMSLDMKNKRLAPMAPEP